MPGLEVVEVIYSDDKRYRVAILRDEKGVFRVHRFRWATEDWDIVREAFWIQDDAFNTITDNLENAKRLAGEILTGR